jgi:CelD/BcsL family acetyltransferase involved in cellulose biosynthesis
MRSVTEPAARLEPIAGPRLPGWLDAHLAPPGEGEFFAGRLWYDTLLAHACPPGATPLLALAGIPPVLVLPLLRLADGGLRCLAGPYSLDWRPLPAPAAGPDAIAEAATAIGRMLRGRAPVIIDTLDPALPDLGPLCAGFSRARLVALRYDHAGNWHEALPAAPGWDAYLAARPPALRSTIRRKLERCRREMDFAAIAAPGPDLEAGIAAYAEVRARSWKPHEPFPDFDAHLLRATAAAGVLRFGLLRAKTDGRPAAAQYWVLDQGGRRAVLLKLAHAEDQRAASPGTALTALMVRRLIEEDGVRELDLGIGDDAYKQLWVGQRRQRIGLALADPLHPAGLAAIARHAAGRLIRRFRR